ncbi:MAG: CapA family protein [Alphaproteobacteria bacterium]|nr:CapA family protein [Alphaproteobacteria bacterium]
MERTVILTGDMNFKGVTDPESIFAEVSDITQSADILFGNLECCFYDVPGHDPAEREGFYAPPVAAEALTLAGFDVVGMANNVTYGEAAIRASLARLDALGIAHTGAGTDRASAYRPAIIEKDGKIYGFLQRTSVFWPKNHAATGSGPGVAVLPGHTAYRPQIDGYAANRPGVPPEIVTWTDRAALDAYCEALATLAGEVDFVVASHHWGYEAEVLAYQTEIAHAAIDAGADIVLGHGPHYPLGIEIYKEKPILYGTGNFSFDVGHHARHGDWIGFFTTIRLAAAGVEEIFIRFVRHTDRNQTILRHPADESEALAELAARSSIFGTELSVEDDRIVIWRRNG